MDASIDFEFHRHLSALEILNRLLVYGWTFDGCTRKYYLPVGDNGMYAWQEGDISQYSLFGIITSKERSHEDIGVAMYWRGTDIGGLFMIWKDGTLSVICNAHRMRLGENGGLEQLTDFNWYIERLYPPLNTDSDDIFLYKCMEIK